MKSKITIDVDWDNQPIIKIEYNFSEDVRDTLIKRFLENFGGDSSWASFRYLENTPGSVASKTSAIRAIPTPETKDQAKLMTLWAKHSEESGVVMKSDLKFDE